MAENMPMAIARCFLLELASYRITDAQLFERLRGHAETLGRSLSVHFVF